MNKLNFFLLIVLLLCSMAAVSQKDLDFEGNTKEAKKILIVPFDPYIYFNDATELIAKKDKLTHDQILDYFRYEFNKQLYNSLMDSCIVVNLLGKVASTREAEDDISNLYSMIGYELRIAMQNRPEDPDNVSKKNKRKEKKEEERRIEELNQSRTRIENGEIVGRRNSNHDKYLHIVLHQPDVLTEISKRYNVEYFLFINQFEIKSNYNSPYISGDPNAIKTMKVHFSLFNSDGMLVHGGFGENTIPFYLDDKREIVDLYFPEVIRQIMRSINF